MDQTFTIGVTSGIVSGLLVSVVVLVFRHYWQESIVPWFEDRVYKGTHLAGVWRTTIFDDGREVGTEQATLQQRAHRVHGTINYPEDVEGRSHTYSVDGEFRDRALTLILREVGESHQDLGAIVLDFKPGGTEPTMEGLGVWAVDGDIKAYQYRWVRT